MNSKRKNAAALLHEEYQQRLRALQESCLHPSTVQIVQCVRETSMKPLGQKAYGHILHLPGSRMGPGAHEGKGNRYSEPFGFHKEETSGGRLFTRSV